MKPIFSLKTKKHWWQKDKIILERDFTIEVSGYTFTLKAGFDSDGASIPRPLWWFSNPFDSQTLDAALAHDGAIWSKKLKRKVADKIFFKLLIINDTPIWKALMFYGAVRIGSWWAYYITPLWEGRPTEEEIKKYLQIKQSVI